MDRTMHAMLDWRDRTREVVAMSDEDAIGSARRLAEASWNADREQAAELLRQSAIRFQTTLFQFIGMRCIHIIRFSISEPQCMLTTFDSCIHPLCALNVWGLGVDRTFNSITTPTQPNHAN